MGARSGLRGSLSADERALLDRLVSELGPRLFAYIRRAYGNLQDAEDIVAETFCRAAKNIGAMRQSTRPDLYLLTITRNLCRDRFRRQRPEAVPDDKLERQAADSVEPVDAALTGEQMELMRAAVAELPANLREVAVLRLSVGLKFEQIAEVLHIPLGTALSRMHTAVQRLRQSMGLIHER